MFESVLPGGVDTVPVKFLWDGLLRLRRHSYSPASLRFVRREYRGAASVQSRKIGKDSIPVLEACGAVVVIPSSFFRGCDAVGNPRNVQMNIIFAVLAN